MPPSKQQRGLLLNESVEIVALVKFESVDCFLPANELQAVLEPVRQDRVGELYFRDFDVEMCVMHQAYHYGLSREKWASCFPQGYLLEVTEVPYKLPLPMQERHALRDGDLLLKVENKLVTNISDLGWQYKHSSLRILIFRDGEEVEVVAPRFTADALEDDEVIQFCGSAVQNPGIVVRMQCQQVRSEVYITTMKFGSSAERPSADGRRVPSLCWGHPV